MWASFVRLRLDYAKSTEMEKDMQTFNCVKKELLLLLLFNMTLNLRICVK